MPDVRYDDVVSRGGGEMSDCKAADELHRALSAIIGRAGSIGSSVRMYGLVAATDAVVKDLFAIRTLLYEARAELAAVRAANAERCPAETGRAKCTLNRGHAGQCSFERWPGQDTQCYCNRPNGSKCDESFDGACRAIQH